MSELVAKQQHFIGNNRKFALPFLQPPCMLIVCLLSLIFPQNSSWTQCLLAADSLLLDCSRMHHKVEFAMWSLHPTELQCIIKVTVHRWITCLNKFQVFISNFISHCINFIQCSYNVVMTRNQLLPVRLTINPKTWGILWEMVNCNVNLILICI